MKEIGYRILVKWILAADRRKLQQEKAYNDCINTVADRKNLDASTPKGEIKR